MDYSSMKSFVNFPIDEWMKFLMINGWSFMCEGRTLGRPENYWGIVTGPEKFIYICGQLESSSGQSTRWSGLATLAMLPCWCGIDHFKMQTWQRGLDNWAMLPCWCGIDHFKIQTWQRGLDNWAMLPCWCGIDHFKMQTWQRGLGKTWQSVLGKLVKAKIGKITK